jgi:hypothetical protein
MTLDAWLPVGHKLPDGAKSVVALFSGPGWQIIETQGDGRALLVRDELADRWLKARLVDEGTLAPFELGVS